MAFNGKYAKFTIQKGDGFAYHDLDSAITSGTVTIEFDAKITATSYGYNGVAILSSKAETDNSDRLVAVTTKPTSEYDNNIYLLIYKDSSGAVQYISTNVVADGSEHSFKLVIDLDNKNVSLYIDGNEVVSSTAYQSSANGNNSVTSIMLILGMSSNGSSIEEDIDNISIQSGSNYVYIDDFESDTTGSTPQGWTAFDPDNTGSNPSIVVEGTSTLPSPPFTLPAGTELSLSVRCTSDNQNYSSCDQFVHPSILYFIKGLTNGYKYLLAITPYPGGNSAYENPSIVFSNDLTQWDEDGVTNPVVAKQGKHNADPHVVWDPINKRILLYYAWDDDNDVWHLGVYESKDGINWNVVNNDIITADTNTEDVSPAVIFDPADNKFKMWYIKYDRSSYTKTLIYRESTDGVNWSDETQCSYDDPGYNGNSWNIWHLSVRKVGNEYWMIAAMNPSGSEDGAGPIHLFFFKSTDGVNWSGYNAPVLDTSNSLATDRLYRSDFIVYNNTIYVIYSYRNSDSTWHIAITSTDVTSLANGNNSSNIISEVISSGGAEVTQSTQSYGYNMLLIIVAIVIAILLLIITLKRNR